MQNERKIILNLAISLDGYIAKKDGNFDWIHGDGSKLQDTEKQFDFTHFLETVDTIVMGKKAYLDAPKESLEAYKDKKIYVATSEKIDFASDNIQRIDGDIVSQILVYKKEEGKNIWLYGGGRLTSHFIKADVVDEYIIGIIPIILGDGIPLFLNDNPTLELTLLESTSQEGVVILRYSRKN